MIWQILQPLHVYSNLHVYLRDGTNQMSVFLFILSQIIWTISDRPDHCVELESTVCPRILLTCRVQFDLLSMSVRRTFTTVLITFFLKF